MSSFTDAQQATLISYLEDLGLEKEGARVYLALVQHGPMTILQVSRAAHVERTRVYRFVGGWVQQGFIEEQLAHKTKIFHAAPLERIKLLMQQKKAAMKALEGSFASFSDQVTSLLQQATATKVLYYNGRDGLRQMLWNTMRTNGEQLTYVHTVWEEAVGYDFFRNWEREYIHSAIKNRELRHPNLLQTRNIAKGPFMEEWPNREWRSISPKILNITHGMEIYNDVVAISYWHNDEAMGIEIYNQYIVAMQRSIFDHYWKLAGKVTHGKK